MALVEYAEAELRKAGFFEEDSDYGGLVGPAVLEMVKQFAEEGHSGHSAHLCMQLFERVASFKPLTPLQNPMETGEYHDVSGYSGKEPNVVLQSTRHSSLFSNDSGRHWHDINLRVPWWKRKLLRQNRVEVQFPYMPK